MNPKKTLTQRIFDLEYKLFIPEEIRSFNNQVEHLLLEIKEKGGGYHMDFLMSICRRQDSYLKRINIIN